MRWVSNKEAKCELSALQILLLSQYRGGENSGMYKTSLGLLPQNPDQIWAVQDFGHTMSCIIGYMLCKVCELEMCTLHAQNNIYCRFCVQMQLNLF